MTADKNVSEEVTDGAEADAGRGSEAADAVDDVDAKNPPGDSPVSDDAAEQDSVAERSISKLSDLMDELSEQPVPDEDAGKAPLTVVGIGASAGGLESLEKFFRTVPADTELAYVVVQHLSPDFKSMMEELLSRRTQIPIHRVEEGMIVEPGNIYLLPPRKEMIISAGRLHLADKDPDEGFTLPIDHFFRSLAQDCGDNAVAVVLSGTGTDGSRGIVEIRKNRGLVISESPESAKFDGMPVAAIQSGVVDYVLDSSKISDAIIGHVYHHNLGNEKPELSVVQPEGVDAIFALLRRKSGIDFSFYKPSTVGRRIERRLKMGQFRDLDDYVEMLRQDDDELDALYRDLLIGVTRFFRDAEPFEMLESAVVPELLKKVGHESDIRVWCPGCATGEEPFSIAILLHEAMTREQRPVNVKVFATDVHQASLDTAGAGLFTANSLHSVSPRRMKRYFKKHGSRYQVSSEIRKMVVFAQHNVMKDAPFTNLDLISCRNLLIYFLPLAQNKVLSLFHFGLKTRGILMMGSSESPGTLANEFETVDEHCKIYRKRRDIRLLTSVHLPLTHDGSSQIGASGAFASSITNPLTSPRRNRPDSALIASYDNLLDRFMPPSFLVDGSRNLIESFGGVEKFLQVKGRRLSSDLLAMLDTDSASSIAGAINRVIKHRQPVSFSGVTFRSSVHEGTYRVTVSTVGNEGRDARYLVSVEPAQPMGGVAASDHDDSGEGHPLTPDAQQDLSTDSGSHEHIRHLENELMYVRENLQASVEEMETANEELQATNEEMVAANEELQSTNEELHSVNEELYTVNAENQKKIYQLDEMNQDMEHLLQSTDVATIFLDEELCVRKFTPGISECFNLIDSDIGRRIDTFSHRIEHDDLLQDLWAVLDDGNPREFEVPDKNGRVYFMRMLPYRASEDDIRGVVLALIDITVLEQARGEVRKLSAIVESSRDAIISTTLDGKILSWNDGAAALYGYSADDIIGRDIFILVPDDQMEDAKALIDRVKNDIPVGAMETERVCQSGARIYVSMTLSPIRDGAGAIRGVSSISRDVTALTNAQIEKARSDEQVRMLLEYTGEAIYGVDENGNCTFVNPACVELMGYRTADEILQRNVHDLLHHTDSDGVTCDGTTCRLTQSFTSGQHVSLAEELLWRKDGSSFLAELSSHPILKNSRPVGAVVTFRSIDERKETTRKLKLEIDRREQFLAMLSHELRNPLSAVRTATRVLNAPNVSPEMVASSRSVIDRQTAHMTTLLDDLLDVSRITHNRIALNRERVDVSQTIEDAVQSVSSLAINSDITIVTKYPDVPVMVMGDVHRLQQVQANLLTNAIKYSTAGKQVVIALCRENDQAVVRVTDWGVGIPQELLGGRIFEMFFQSDETLDRSQGGMGVGLTLVKTLVELHDGSVAASSKGVGKGSQFTIRLPLAAMTEEAEAQDKVEADDHSPEIRNLVIVEDQEDNRNMVTSMLEMEGYQVLAAAGTGLEGLDAIRQLRPDAAIIDIGLPEMDGFEVARQLRSDEASGEFEQPLLLIALTGYGQPQDVELAHTSGFDHHLVKPLHPERLLEILGSGRPR